MKLQTIFLNTFIYLVASVCLFSCHKNDKIEETQSLSSESAQMIYVTATAESNSYTLFAYAVNGQKRWEQANIRPLFYRQAFADNALYMADNEKMHCWNAETGASKWTYGTGVTLVQPKLQGDTLLTAATTIAPSFNNKLILLRKDDGAWLWEVAVTEQPLVPPVMSEGKIYSLTTNGTGTRINLTAFDIKSKTQLWQKVIAGGFLMSLPPEMAFRGDTLLVGSFSSSITLVNKHTGDFYWSKSLRTKQSFLMGGEIVYNDNNCGCVKKISLQSGETIFQGQEVYHARFEGQSYIYNNHFYYHVLDSLYRTNLTDGSVRRTKVAGMYLGKLSLVGKMVYASKKDVNIDNESRIMILDADDLAPKDSIRIPSAYIGGFSILTSSRRLIN